MALNVPLTANAAGNLMTEWFLFWPGQLSEEGTQFQFQCVGTDEIQQ
jgi:hypothetical protein